MPNIRSYQAGSKPVSFVFNEYQELIAVDPRTHKPIKSVNRYLDENYAGVDRALAVLHFAESGAAVSGWGIRAAEIALS